MIKVMFNERSRENCGIVMSTIVDRQIPGVGAEDAGQDGAGCRQVDNGESEPYLPEDLVDSVLRAGVMKPVPEWSDGMQHKAMRDVFGQGPRPDAATEQKNSRARLKG